MLRCVSDTGDHATGTLSTAAEAFHLAWSGRRRRHQAAARWHHYRRHLRLALDPG